MYRERFHFEAVGATLGQAVMPSGKVKFDETFQKNVETYRHTITIKLPVEAGGAFTLKATGQGCADKGLCYAPMTTEAKLAPTGGGLMAAVAAAKGALAENSSAPQTSPATASQFDAVDKPAIQQPTSAPQSVPVQTAAIPAAPTQGQLNLNNPTAIPTWKTRIVALLERNKRYPAAAQSRRERGTAQVFFSLDRQGHVIESRIVRSSGAAALDEEALALLNRAQPFPTPPPELAGERVNLTVPIRFNLK